MIGGQWIGGREAAGTSGETSEVIDPATGEVIEVAALAGPRTSRPP